VYFHPPDQQNIASGEFMPSAEYDLRYLNAGTEQLQSYIFSKKIYWAIGVKASKGETPYPQMTLGGLLLARYRLQATAKTTSEKEEYTRLKERMDLLRSRWHVTWGKKAQTEFQARLNLWHSFLEEYLDKPTANFDRYKFEVVRRVLLDLLQAECENIPNAKTELLTMLDLRLKNTYIKSDFIWETNLASIFPPERYWYLYGYLPEK
jgi:hypothetical protein